MPRLLSAALTWEKNRLDSDHVLTMLAQLDIAGAPGSYRFVNYEEDVTFHGLSFLQSSFAVDAIEDTTTMTLARLRITVENVSREMQSLLELYWPSNALFTVTTWFPVDMAQPNEMPFGAGEFYTVAQASTDLKDAVIDLMADGITFTGTLPKRRYTTSGGFSSIPRRIG